MRPASLDTNVRANDEQLIRNVIPLLIETLGGSPLLDPVSPLKMI
jgi:hypothetical protein